LSETVEVTGKSVEAAISAAEEQFGAQRDELEIQVLSQGSRGVFGLGGEPARISVRRPGVPTPEVAPAQPEPVRDYTQPKAEPEPKRPRAQRVAEPELKAASVTTAERVAEPVRDSVRDEAAPSFDELSVAARDVLAEMLSHMGFDVEVSVRSREEPIVLDVTGENLGVLIGRRGDSLAALQFMINVILSKRFRKWPRVVIDVQGYRARREQSLQSLGVRVADRVRRNRRPFTLEAMPANDRRIIHLSLRDRTDVETYSVGEGAARRVVIAPKR
jgi:spoIIIJ-associated protein